MVFRVRATLMEEDRAGWRRLASQRKRTARRKYRRTVRSWLGNKLYGVGSTASGVLMLYAVISGGMKAGWGVVALVLTVIGPWTFLTAGRHPVWGTFSPPGRDFPPSVMLDGPVKAAFFRDGCFVFWDVSEKVRRSYSSIAAVWEDEGRFYLLFQDRPPLVLPKRGVVQGTPEDFRDFFERKLGRPVERIK